MPQEARIQPATATARHAKAANLEEADGVQEKLAVSVEEHRKEHPDRAVEVWAFDEHQVGLKPVPRRQWAPKGRRPVAVGHPRYEWL